MDRKIDTLIIGGGQAGLATSYYLKESGREHLVLEKATEPAPAWRNDRWDSFTLVTPNWCFKLPGAEYDGDRPEGFMPRDQIVANFERYIQRHNLPVQFGQRVLSVDANGRFKVKTEDGMIEAQNVVIATGLYQRPKLPPFARDLSPNILQLHSGQYRNPDRLPPGAVLVVGSAQSGCQIAEELYQSGRKVYLATGTTGRAPRRYRGKDIFEWLELTHFLDRTADQLPSSKAKFIANPQVSGKNGGHSLNLHVFARDGVTLLGRLVNGNGYKIQLGGDLNENLAKVDQFEQQITGMIDKYIAQTGMDVPEEDLPVRRDGYTDQEITELDLQAAGVSTIIWANGYRFDYNLVKLPVFGLDGFPTQNRGVTQVPGLYFVGLPWLHTQKSGLLHGVAEDARYLAEVITNTIKPIM